MFCYKEPDVLDLSKTSATIKTEHIPGQLNIKEEHIAAQLMVWNRLALDLSHSPKVEPEISYDSGSYSGSENSKESLELNTTHRCSSAQSSESAETPTSRKHRIRRESVVKDDNYYERRRKNNMAAKKSRDAKRKRESELRNKLVLLQDENYKLKGIIANCRCIQKTATVFIPTAYNLSVPYREPHPFLPVAANLRS